MENFFCSVPINLFALNPNVTRKLSLKKNSFFMDLECDNKCHFCWVLFVQFGYVM